MSKIQIGDLVMIVKPTPCCNNPRNIGQIHKVLKMRDALVNCGCCNKKYLENSVVIFNHEVGLGINRVIKIEPLNEKELTIESERLEA